MVLTGTIWLSTKTGGGKLRKREWNFGVLY